MDMWHRRIGGVDIDGLLLLAIVITFGTVWYGLKHDDDDRKAARVFK